MEYVISTDKSKLNIDIIHTFLTNCYWAKGIPRSLVEKCIANSLCFGAHLNDEQIGFARIVSDFSTFAYLADVFVLEEHRGKGVSRMMMDEIIKHPQLQGLRRFMLATKDAHGLYEKYGFVVTKNPERMMEIVNADVYLKKD
jgi:GNAT superfamily N-acetyltransferase